VDRVTQSRPARIVDTIYLICQLVPAALLVAFIVGSLLFTGGQVLDDGERIYDEVWRWPVFPVPAALLIVPAAVSAVLVVPLVVLTRVAVADRLINRWGQTFVAVGAGVAFAIAFPSPSGPLPVPNSEDSFLGAHWIAAALSAFCWVVLVLGMLAKLPAHQRLRDSRQLQDRPS